MTTFLFAMAVVVDGVYLDGKGPFRFVVDTGAQSTVIEQSLASFEPQYQVDLVTVNGSHFAPARRMLLEVAGERLECVEVLAQDLAAVRARVPDVQGILGQSALRRLDYRIDVKQGRIEIGARAPAGAAPTPFVWHADRMQIEGAIEGKRYRLDLDSGASHLVLYERPPGWQATGQAELRTMAGRSVVDFGAVRRMAVGTKAWTRVEAGLAPRPVWGNTSDGLMPVTLFDSIYVSNRRGSLVLE